MRVRVKVRVRALVDIDTYHLFYILLKVKITIGRSI